MQSLVEFVLKSVVKHPDQLQLTPVEGASSLLVEMRLNAEDAAVLRRDQGQLLQAIQVVLSAASGPRKVVLDLIDDAVAASSEE